MITCVVEYVIDPVKIDAFERFPSLAACERTLLRPLLPAGSGT